MSDNNFDLSPEEIASLVRSQKNLREGIQTQRETLAIYRKLALTAPASSAAQAIHHSSETLFFLDSILELLT